MELTFSSNWTSMAAWLTSENISFICEIIAIITGTIYVFLEIKQKTLMWYVGIVTVLSCAINFYLQSYYASMLLNVYYAVFSVWGIYQWKKQEKAMSSETTEKQVSGSDAIHLSRLSLKVVLVSVLSLIMGLLISYLAVYIFNKIILMYSLNISLLKISFLDLFLSLTSIIATIWLAKSYLHHWFLWLMVDTLYTYMCYNYGLIYMSLLYLVYTITAIYGYYHWYKIGKFLK